MRTMVRAFPDLLHDELLYSACARYSDRVRYPSKFTLINELFGTHASNAVVDVPGHLNYFVHALSPAHNLTVDYVIDDHTLFPFYAPFLRTGDAELVRAEMTADDGRNLQMRAGVVVNRFPPPRMLRFCPFCLDHDKQYFGEGYWHRAHQLPGIVVCPRHGCLLERSAAFIRHSSNRAQFISAESATWSASPHLIKSSSLYHQNMLALAQDGAWLLNHRDLCFDAENLYQEGVTILAARGVAHTKSPIYNEELSQPVRIVKSKYFFQALFEANLGGEIESEWLKYFVYRSHYTWHPMYPLVLMHCLGYTAETYFMRFQENSKLSHSGNAVSADELAGSFTFRRGYRS